MARILIIDDEESILESLQILLQQAGHTVETATNGEVINRHMNGTSPDLILLDYYLPDRNGDSIACELKTREDTKHIPIVMISASYSVKRIALSVGADDFLSKPFNFDDLLTKLDRVIKQRPAVH